MKENQTIKPFAMRCTQEQFDDVKEELEKYQRIYYVSNFYDFPILLLKHDGVTNASDDYCTQSNIIVGAWNKSFFLKMAGKPDAESRKLLGYKRNPELDITAKQLAQLLECSEDEKDGLFFWGLMLLPDSPVRPIILRAQSLGIVGEGKWLVPVYKTQEKGTRSFGSLRHLTYEQQKDL